MTRTDAAANSPLGAMAGVTVRRTRPDELARVASFYRAMHYLPALAEDDIIFVAESDGALCGAVRLCREGGMWVLRGMRVSPGLQRRGIGPRLLRAVEPLLDGQECYCIPHRHLRSFYAQIGFVEVDARQVPAFLHQRCLDYRRTYGLDVIIMYRAGQHGDTPAGGEDQPISGQGRVAVHHKATNFTTASAAVNWLLEAVAAWADGEPYIVGILLVGSHARGTAKSSSDVDLVLLTEDPQSYLQDLGWASRFGSVARWQAEDWGMVQSLRVWYADSTEVEFGLTTPEWLAAPLDGGTRLVLEGGYRVIYDRDGRLEERLSEFKTLLTPLARWSPGTAIAYREVWRGQVWTARALTVVQDEPDWIALYMWAGGLWKLPAGERDRFLHYLQRGEWQLKETTIPCDHLILVQPGASYAAHVTWTAGDRRFQHWYINLQEPLRRTAIGFDFMDHVLDIVVQPDLSSWVWKDEAELQQAQELGLFSADQVRHIRAAGQQVIARLQAKAAPFCDGWEAWTPPDDWTVPALPAGWDRA